MHCNHQHNRSINRTELYNVTQCEQKQSEQYSKNRTNNNKFGRQYKNQY